MAAQRSATDALDRFLTLANELKRSGGWTEDKAILRHAATTLPLLEVEPIELAARYRAVIQELARATHWWQEASGSVRYVIAASIVRQEERVPSFLSEVERVRKLFRAERLPRGSTSEILAFVTLRESAAGGRVTSGQVARMRELFTEIKKDHRWLLGADEYPTIALLATTEVDAGLIARRVEHILQSLESHGFGSRGRLMPASQLLFLAPEPDSMACDQFRALWKEFQARGLRMNSADYDEVALLAHLPRDAREVVRLVLEHRAGIDTLRPKPGREIGFSLACSTAFVQLVGSDRKLRRLAYTQIAIQIRGVIAERRAAAAAAS